MDGTGRLLVGLGCGFVGAIIGYLLFRGKTDFDGLVIVMVLTLLTGGIGLFIFITIYFEEYLISVFDKIKSAYNKKYPDCKSYYGIEDEFD